jgi:hypothetical protein
MIFGISSRYPANGCWILLVCIKWGHLTLKGCTLLRSEHEQVKSFLKKPHRWCIMRSRRNIKINKTFLRATRAIRMEICPRINLTKWKALQHTNSILKNRVCTKIIVFWGVTSCSVVGTQHVQLQPIFVKKKLTFLNRMRTDISKRSLRHTFGRSETCVCVTLLRTLN